MKPYISHVPQIRMGFDTIERTSPRHAQQTPVAQSRLREFGSDASHAVTVSFAVNAVAGFGIICIWIAIAKVFG